MFGHEAGSFTGAAKTRHGRFEEADGGTLFLDELATLSSPAQDRLLRAVEYGEITRIGASQADPGRRPHRRRDQRASAARWSTRAGSAPTCSTACRSRSSPCRRCARASGDIPLLAEHFGRRMAVELEWPNWPGFSTRAVVELETYRWPGNVRELRNVVERAVYRAEDPERPIDAIQFDPFHSPWAPADSAVGGARAASRSERSGAARRARRAAGADRRFARRGQRL